MSQPRFSGKVAVISGSAQGIGRACAQRLASEGATLVLLDKDQPANLELATACQALGNPALALHCDVSNPQEVNAAFDQLHERFGGLDLVVNSAGIYHSAPIESIDDRQWHHLLATNLDGTFHCCRAATPLLKAAAGGSIINISSMAARAGFPATVEYSTSKSAQIGLTRSLAIELAPYGITVNAVCPGNTLTPMLQQVAAHVAPSLHMSPAQWLAMRQQDCPLGRFAEPWEIAGVVAFLASPDARYITGQAIQVDGGMELR